MEWYSKIMKALGFRWNLIDNLSIDNLEIRMMESSLVGIDQLSLISSSSGVYPAWLTDCKWCIYVGIAGNLRGRIRSHFLGQRGGDQFCLYCYDEFMHPLRCKTPNNLKTREVNRMTAEWAQSHVQFRWIELKREEAQLTERDLRRKRKPLLNPL